MGLRAHRRQNRLSRATVRALQPCHGSDAMNLSLEILGITLELSITAGTPEGSSSSSSDVVLGVTTERNDEPYETNARGGFGL